MGRESCRENVSEDYNLMQKWSPKPKEGSEDRTYALNDLVLEKYFWEFSCPPFYVSR
jgi:hypothetical protein